MAKKARTPKPPRPAASGERRVQAPQRRTGPARKSTAAAAPVGGFKYFWPTAAVLVVLVIVGIALGIALTRGPSKPPKLALTTPISWTNLPALQTGKPPWPSNSATLSARIVNGTLGLSSLSQEALAYHIHAHLDLFVNGQHVTLPQLIGIASSAQSPTGVLVTEVHTHHTDGIIHVESAQHLNYQLVQLFGEWGVRLTSKCLGSFKGSCDNLQWRLNGKKAAGNPGNVILRNHEEIAISIGKPPAKVPTSFDFKAHGV